MSSTGGKVRDHQQAHPALHEDNGVVVAVLVEDRGTCLEACRAKQNVVPRYSVIADRLRVLRPIKAAGPQPPSILGRRNAAIWVKIVGNKGSNTTNQYRLVAALFAGFFPSSPLFEALCFCPSNLCSSSICALQVLQTAPLGRLLLKSGPWLQPSSFVWPPPWVPSAPL